MQHPLRAAVAAAAFVPALSAQSAPSDLLRSDFGLPLLVQQPPSIGPLSFDDQGECVEPVPLSLDGYWDLSPTYQDMVARLFRLPRRRVPVQACWLTKLTPQAAALFTAAMQPNNSFQPQTRWSFTASSGGGLQYGDPTVLRYSFVPDGTFIPPGVGEPGASSNMFATLNAAFGSQAAWQNVIHSAFDRWEDLTGLTCVFEPNDDGATHGVANGVVNVRGDVRIGMKFIDGGSGILAYNAYPDDGDMVLDSGDVSYFSNPSQLYRRFFNTLTHELGHGLGIAHTCPVNNTKLMEPFSSTAFSGPQFDDVLSGQRLYGDPNEPNDSTVSATALGTVSDGLTNVTNQSIDGSSDVDNFSFSVLSAKIATIRAVPVGASYLEGPQLSGGNCSSGTLFNPSQLRNLAIYLFNGSGTTLLAFSATAPIGQSEVLSSYPLTGGDYMVRVFASGTDTIQPYRLELDIVDNGPVAVATSVGAGCAGLTWNALTRPVIGNTLVQTLTGIPNPTGSIGLVLMGSTGIPGGLDLASLGAPGCRVYQQTDSIVPVFPLSISTMVYTMPIPNDPLLAGATFWTQGALLVPPGTNALGGVTANATELFLGTQ